MKRTLTFILFLCCFSARSQNILLHEAGGNTNVSILADCNGIFSNMTAGGCCSFTNFSGSSNDTLRFMFYDDHADSVHFTITKHLPVMATYASLELFADMTLPDSIGWFEFMVSPDSLSWYDVPNSAGNQPVLYDNSAGNAYLRMRVHLIQTDSVHFSYNYYSIKADPNAFVSLSETGTDNLFSIAASGSAVKISTSSSEEYRMAIRDLNGKVVFEAPGNGSQVFSTPEIRGIHLVTVQSEQELITEKYYFGE